MLNFIIRLIKFFIFINFNYSLLHNMSLQPKMILLLLFINSYIYLRAQYTPDSSYAQALAVYNHTLGIGRHLYNGREYTDYDHRIKGTPFFSNTYFTSGSIVYDGISYTDVQLFYDELNDNIVMKNYNDTAIILLRQKTAAFDILGHHFVNLQIASSAATLKDSGFYDVLYNSNVKLFAKRAKTIVQKISISNSESFFNEKNFYYIQMDNKLYAVRDKNSVLDVLKDKKSAVSKFLHQSHIKFKRNAEAAIIKMVAFYDSLNNAK